MVDTIASAAGGAAEVWAVMERAWKLAAQFAVDDPSSPLSALKTARDLAAAVDRATRAAVDRARERGHTWQEIGEVLGTTRQAAVQRFGRPLDPRTGRPMAEAMLPGAVDRAVELFADLVERRWSTVCQNFDDQLVARLNPEGLATVWAHIVGIIGDFERIGAPLAHQAGDYTVVDVPLAFEAGDRVGRVSFDQHGKVAGLFFLPSHPEPAPNNGTAENPKAQP
jgi:hypothetical protein